MSTTSATRTLPAATLRNLRLSTDEPTPPTQKNVPSNSNATGTTSGCPPSPSVAKRASGCDRKYAVSASSKDILATSS